MQDRRFRPFVLPLAFALANPAAAATYYVNQSTGNDTNTGAAPGLAVKTVTRGVALLGDGDTLQIAAGTYDAATGEIFPIAVRHDVDIVGAGRYATIIDGKGIVPNLLRFTGDGQTFSLRRIAVVGSGSTSGQSSNGVRASDPVDALFSDCRIAGHTGPIGAGLFVGMSDAAPASVTISACEFADNAGSIGSALQFQQNGDGDYTLQIEDSTFVRNTASSGVLGFQENGAGHHVLRIERSRFADNDGGAGGVVASLGTAGDNGTRLVANSLFVGNPGAALASHRRVDIVNSTFVGNGVGARIDVGAQVVNSIFWNNTVALDGNGASIAWSLVQGLDVGDHVDDGGLIDGPPLFAAGYRLQRSSPAIDRGLDNATDAAGLVVDFDGNPRKRAIVGNGRPEGVVDLGAFEYTPLFIDGFEPAP